MSDWNLPAGHGLDEQWRDAYISTQLADVLSRRHYGLPFLALDVAQRNVIRTACEDFVIRMAQTLAKERVL